MKLTIFDTLKHGETEFNPLHDSKVNLYTCGPTVYNQAHIGNLRAYVFADVLYKTLNLYGYKVNWVMNITDVDDKTIHNTIVEDGSEANIDNLRKFTTKYLDIFLEDIEKTGLNKDNTKFIRILDVIPQIQDFIVKLLDKGYAYKSEDGVFFNIEKYQAEFGDYGALVGAKFMEGKKVGARVKVDEYEKENLSDFALWKAWDPSDGNIFWNHPALGKGRPGWHIECTVINYQNFPKGTDIHTGGVDHLFPHHTNEIAQAQPIYKPFVCHWMHMEHILVNGQKMSKSLGNVYTLSDLEEKGVASGLDLRYLYLQTHYRTRMNLTMESLAAAKNGLQNIYNRIAKLREQTTVGKPIQSFIESFTAALNDDLNTPEALSLVSNILDADVKAEDKLATLYEMDKVFGLNFKNATGTETNFVSASNLDSRIKELLTKRDQARQNKNFSLSDEIRADLESQGYKVVDTSEGTKLEKA